MKENATPSRRTAIGGLLAVVAGWIAFRGGYRSDGEAGRLLPDPDAPSEAEAMHVRSPKNSVKRRG